MESDRMVPERKIRNVYPLGTVCHSGAGRVGNVRKRMTVEEYEKYFEQFDPTDYNPREWARLAKSRYEICGADCKASRWILFV